MLLIIWTIKITKLTKINNDDYNLKNVEQFLLEFVTKKINENEARKLYKNLIKPKVDKLANAKDKGKDKRSNVLNILHNIKLSIFDGLYYHYFNKPKATKKSISERIKLRRQRLDIVKEKEKNIHNELFSNCKDEINKYQIYLIKKALTKIKNAVKNVPKDKTFRIEENEKIIDIAERILELNNENQLGEDLKILTPSQMLSRLPQSKAGNNSEKLKIEIRPLLLQNNSMKDWLTLIKTWKQSL